MTQPRLDQLETALAILAQDQVSSRQRMDQTDTRITQMADAVNLLVQVTGQQSQAITQLIEAQQQTFARMDTMQSEIRDLQTEVRDIQTDVRGLQTENRRILDILQNRQSED